MQGVKFANCRGTQRLTQRSTDLSQSSAVQTTGHEAVQFASSLSNLSKFAVQSSPDTSQSLPGAQLTTSAGIGCRRRRCLCKIRYLFTYIFQNFKLNNVAIYRRPLKVYAHIQVRGGTFEKSFEFYSSVGSQQSLPSLGRQPS